jgi:hypothetical protein
MSRCVLDSSKSGLGLLVGSCVNGNEIYKISLGHGDRDGLIQLMARKDFITFFHGKSFKSYKVMKLWVP